MFLWGAFDSGDGQEFDLEDLAGEKEEGMEGDVLGGGGDIAVGGKVGEIGADFGDTHVFGVGFATVKFDVASDGMEVGLFGAIGEMWEAHFASAFFQKAVEGHGFLQRKNSKKSFASRAEMLDKASQKGYTKNSDRI